MRKIFTSLAMSVLLLSGVSCQKENPFSDPTKNNNDSGNTETGGGSDTTTDAVVLWKNNDKVNGKTYISFRIPTLLRTPNKLFAFIEARTENTDRGDIDIVY